jgi:predicted nucleic acid-binding protein
LEREKKLELDQIKITKIKTMLLGISNLVRSIEKFEVTVDPKDNKIIECAVAGNVDYLVSGDKGILILKEFRGIKIVSVAEMFEIIFPAYSFLL